MLWLNTFKNNAIINTFYIIWAVIWRQGLSNRLKQKNIVQFKAKLIKQQWYNCLQQYSAWDICRLCVKNKDCLSVFLEYKKKQIGNLVHSSKEKYRIKKKLTHPESKNCWATLHNSCWDTVLALRCWLSTLAAGVLTPMTRPGQMCTARGWYDILWLHLRLKWNNLLHLSAGTSQLA